jgi:hypothetical protein
LHYKKVEFMPQLLVGTVVLVCLDVRNVCPDREFVYCSTDCLKDVEVGTEEVEGSRHLVINSAVDMILYNTFVLNWDQESRGCWGGGLEPVCVVWVLLQKVLDPAKPS